MGEESGKEKIAEVRYKDQQLEVETIDGKVTEYKGGFRRGLPIESYQQSMGADSVRAYETDNEILVEHRVSREPRHGDYGNHTEVRVDRYFKSQIVRISTRK